MSLFLKAASIALEVTKGLPRGSTVVAILPDRGGDRYLSTEVSRYVCALCPL